ncbi:glycoside hydrolase family 3 C-terminal domain-containing protein [Rhizobium sp. AAP116]|uniref:glycoside hydrolase family 3 C-terminal domain-containing protein n=1 Tax=Rhizobium sp. AAP116 TaxID=1523429 RepID=UPI0006B9636D|nr:glycoside hydrolase family 3 C-terminal domain-containing protein [Rhizobium sp. AAP116]KPF60963.1 beta-glucosidase [Rhizobium sp. AAP116]
MLDELLDQMTLEEQVALLAGADFWTTVAVERLGVPKIKVTDGPNGARGGGSLVGGVKSACFPAAIGIGASWNPELVREMGVALAEEAKTKSARVLLAPTVNIHRSGLNGRNFECYSEDPMLTSALAVAYIEGVQSQGIAATIKHFVANESEVERQTMSSDLDERTLREIYLPPFEAAVKKAGVWAIMSSYNRLNGAWTSENHWLLTELLRAEWGYDGIVMSDWFGSHTTEASVIGGLDLEMPGPTRDRGEKLVAAVREGRVPAETVKAAARRMLLLLERVGAFEDPKMEEEKAVDRPEHRALIRKLGAEGMVLLKNDGILPLDKSALDRIAVLGPNAAEPRVMGGGSAQINAHYKVSPLEGIRTALSGTNRVMHLKACRNNRLTQMIGGEVFVDFFHGRDWSGPVVQRSTAEETQFFWLDMPDASLDPRNFSARITTRFRPEETGNHIFGLTNAGFAKLYVDGELVVDGETGWAKGDNFFGLGNTEVRVEKPLEAGRTYEIRVDYRAMPEGYEGIEIRAVRFGVELPTSDAAIAEAVEQAKACDLAILLVGREGEWDTEGLDLPNMRLPGRQEELIEKVAAVNPRTVVVLQTGGPVEMPWLDKVSAVIEAWYPGQEAGNAIADVLFGDAEPGGRLPQTFPQRLSDNSTMTGDPRTYPGENGHVVYAEGLAVGYRHHDADGAKPLFPFGYGLSYTTFAWSVPRASSVDMGADGVAIEIEVTNTGDRAGAELVQLYVKSKASRLRRPVKELKAFAKLHVMAGETATARLSLAVRDLAYFDPQARAWIAEAGEYELVIAANAEDVRATLPLKLVSEWREVVSAPPLPAVVD